jgi:phospholipid/cholesterol/gamma-HCH transport system ATP-binding protein
VLSVSNLHVTLGGRQILNGVDFDLKDGESLVILGCSGTGKSVLLKSILGLIPKTHGNIIVDGVDIDKANKHEKSQKLGSIGMLFQGGALFDSLPVWENVAFGLIYGKKMKLEEAKEIALEKLELVDLDKKVAFLFPAALSGGMLKRVSLARALASMPRIIFFDEPTTGLDPITSNIVNDLIVKYVKHSDLGAVTITHDLTCLRKIADRIAFLFDGKIVWTGSVQGMDCTENPYIRQFIDAIPTGPLTEKRH